VEDDEADGDDNDVDDDDDDDDDKEEGEGACEHGSTGKEVDDRIQSEDKS
jgi:hypothetical protein